MIIIQCVHEVSAADGDYSHVYDDKQDIDGKNIDRDADVQDKVSARTLREISYIHAVLCMQEQEIGDKSKKKDSLFRCSFKDGLSVVWHRVYESLEFISNADDSTGDAV